MKNLINNIKTELRTMRINSADKASQAQDIIRIDGLNSYTTTFNSWYEAKQFAKFLGYYAVMQEYHIIVSGKIVKARRK